MRDISLELGTVGGRVLNQGEWFWSNNDIGVEARRSSLQILGLKSPTMLGSLASRAGSGQGWAEGSHAGAGGDLLLHDMDNGLVTFINSEVPLLYPQLMSSVTRASHRPSTFCHSLSTKSL